MALLNHTHGLSLKVHPKLIAPALYLLTLLLAAAFALRTPAWQAPDEPAHYAYVQTVAQTGLPPVLQAQCYSEAYKNALISANFDQPVDFGRFCYEGHQPPLFYYLAAPIFALSGGSLLALRLFCALLGAAVPVAAWGIVRAAGGSQWLALAVGLLVALLPQHLAMIGSLNNDALTFLLVALAMWQMVRLLQPAIAIRRSQWILLGLLLGACLLTKTLAWVVLPPALLLLGMRHRLSVRAPLLALALAGILVLPWIARNSVTYGGWDVMGLERHDEVAVGQPRTDAEVARRGAVGTLANGVQTTFHSFWGQFGWMKAPLQPREYQVLAVATLVALAGLLLWLSRRGWHRDGMDARALRLLAALLVTNVALLLYYNLEFVQYQGRYLFPALTAIATAFMIGLGAWLPVRLRPLPWGALLLFLLYLDAMAIWQRLPGMMTY